MVDEDGRPRPAATRGAQLRCVARAGGGIEEEMLLVGYGQHVELFVPR